MLGETATSADKEELRRNLGLDQPLLTQYRNFLADLRHRRSGTFALRTGERRRRSSARACRRLLQLALCAMIAALLISFPLAILAAINRGTWLDRWRLFFSFLGLSMPNFWLGPLLMILFSIQLGWLPVSGRGGSAI